MLPLKDGSYVVAKFVEDLRDIRSGQTYIIVTLNEGIVYKRVYNELEKRHLLVMKSDNEVYEPFETPLNEILEAWEFTCSINTQEYEPHELKISSILQMFNELQVELKSLQKSVS
jgi:hypothetical protein